MGFFIGAIHHYLTYQKNFMGTGEYLKKMHYRHSPYGRMLILHFVILFGGALVQKTGDLIWALVILIVLKTGLDLVVHNWLDTPNKERT